MNRLQKLYFITILFSAVFIFTGGKAEASTTYSGSAGTSPSGYRVMCQTGVPVDFAAHPSNISLNTATGVVSYNINVTWRNCGSTPTRAYAIYADPDICPLSGIYGANSPYRAYDCVKYIGNPAFQGAGNILECGVPVGTLSGWSCVNTANFLGARRVENAPSGTSSISIPMSYVIPGWSAARLVSGSHTTGNRAMCQYYKTGPPSFSQHSSHGSNSAANSRCQNISVSVSWTFTAPNSGSCTVSIAGPIQPGSILTVSYQVSNSGQQPWSVHPTNINRYRLRPDGSTHGFGVPADIYIPENAPNIESTGFGYILYDGRSTYWTGSITVPADIVPAGQSSVTRTLGFRVWGFTPSNPVLHSIGPVCSTSITVTRPADRPYFRTYGGDIIVGRQFRSPDGTCDAKFAGAELKGYSRQLGGAYVGAGSQLAVSATGAIEGVISAGLRNGLSGNPILPPNGLTFGNSDGINNLGYDQTGYTGCMPDYYTEISTGSGSSMGIGNISGDIDPGYHYRDGDLTLTGDINVAGGGAMETVTIVVKGNIYINPNVTEINAILIAQPDPDNPTTTGTINTCSGGTWADCTNKLTVNGAFSARKVYLNRINGTVGNIEDPNESSGSHNIAEVFNYRPLPVLITPTGSQPLEYQYGSVYDTIVGLPPVL